MRAGAVLTARRRILRRRPRDAGPARVTVATQVGAVLSMRVAALRGPARVRSAVGLGLALALVVSTPLVGMMLPRARVGEFEALLPTAWALFALATSVAIVSGAGGRQLLTREQGVAFPLSAAADHCGALLLTPLNISWLAQACGLLGTTAWVVGPTPWLALALALTLAWIVATTVIGQAMGWTVELVRTTAGGVAALRAALGAAAVAVAAVTVSGRLPGLLDGLPTTTLVGRVLQAGHGRPTGALRSLLALAAITAVGWWLGARLLGAVQRRPALPQSRAESQTCRRRPEPGSALRASLRVDRAGVWRSVPLRRGVSTLVLIPGAVVAASGLRWGLVPMMPGLVVAGAGLLFGVNALALDGPGALWRDTLPADPRLHLGARLAVVAETCLGGAALVCAVAAVRAPAAPTGGEVVAVGAAVLATSAAVLARCADWSVHRPYAAGLREARDQPAPPAAMAGYATRLAVSTTLIGLLFTWLAALGSVPATLAIGAATLLLPARRLLAVLQLWRDPTVRGRVLATVTGS